ncbi:hypothetical protein QYF61_007985 [Mycteria americana]|uniref:Uncharacterized protein n=1 Tax=Mycteria americana TaxID=33587 RepID=A0AAN7PPD6_MYCAM|nr:hypothetical protein QYF61_007985 [Mycteria americana]
MTGLRARPTFAVPVPALNNRQSVLGLDLGLDWAALVFVIQHTSIPLPAFPRLSAVSKFILLSAYRKKERDKENAILKVCRAQQQMARAAACCKGKEAPLCCCKVFEVRPQQCRVQGHDHFPSPAGHAIFDTSQDAIGFLGHLGTLLAHIQAAVNQHPQVLLCLAAFQPLFPKPVALHGVAVAQVQDLALGLVEPHTIHPSPSIQPVQVPLQSLPTLKQINTPTQLGVICKLTEGALDPFIQIIDKDVKQNWPQHRALGNTTCDRPPTRVNSIHHHSLGLAVQPVLYPAKSTPVQAMSSQFLQENAVGNRVKGFTKV